MKFVILLAALVLAGCGDSTHILSYDELVRFRTSCTNKDNELRQLHDIQRFKNFAADPDQLNEEDRAYNSRLKATIWWYAVECNREKNSTTVNADH